MVPIHNRLSEDEDDDEEGVFASHTGLDNVLDALSLGNSGSSPNMKVCIHVCRFLSHYCIKVILF